MVRFSVTIIFCAINVCQGSQSLPLRVKHLFSNLRTTFGVVIHILGLHLLLKNLWLRQHGDEFLPDSLQCPFPSSLLWTVQCIHICSVSDPDPHGSALRWTPWIQIRVRIRDADSGSGSSSFKIAKKIKLLNIFCNIS